MPLTSFAEVPQPVMQERDFAFRRGTPDLAEAAGVANQAMFELGLAGPDRDENLEEIADDFNVQSGAGYDGLLHVLPNQAVPFEYILAVAEGKRPVGVSPASVYSNLWTPGTEKNSYTKAELNTGPAGHVARLALFNSQNTGYDPILHSLNVPFDSHKYEEIDVNPDAVPTQLEELEEDIVAFETQHPNYTLEELDHRAFAMLALMDRIRGVKIQDQILSAGFMRVPSLGRRSVDGHSLVGHVYSYVGRLRFGGSTGSAYLGVGAGRSMGLSEA